MARTIQSRLEEEADRKGLEGKRREAYIGGAWQNITQGRQRRALWQGSDDARALAALVGDIADLRLPKSRPDTVVFRQGAKWYELPVAEHLRLVKEGRKLLKAQERDTARERRAIAEYERALAQEQRQEARATRAAERERAGQDRQLAAMHRTQHQEVRAIIRERGGIRRVRDNGGAGRVRDAGEIASMPRDLLARSRARGLDERRGLTLDDAAREVNMHMPWLGIETPNDLLDFFAGEGVYRNRQLARRMRGDAA